MLEESEDRQIIRKLRDELRCASERVLSQAETICALRKELSELRMGLMLRNRSLNSHGTVRRNGDSVGLRTNPDE